MITAALAVIAGIAIYYGTQQAIVAYSLWGGSSLVVVGILSIHLVKRNCTAKPLENSINQVTELVFPNQETQSFSSVIPQTERSDDSSDQPDIKKEINLNRQEIESTHADHEIKSFLEDIQDPVIEVQQIDGIVASPLSLEALPRSREAWYSQGLDLELSFCDCKDLEQRLTYEASILEEVLNRFPPQNQVESLNLLSIGSGALLQDFLLLNSLILNGYKKISLTCLDPEIDPPKIHKIEQFFKRFSKIEINITSFAKNISSYLKVTNPSKMHGIYSIDFLFLSGIDSNLNFWTDLFEMREKRLSEKGFFLFNEKTTLYDFSFQKKIPAHLVSPALELGSNETQTPLTSLFPTEELLHFRFFAHSASDFIGYIGMAILDIFHLISLGYKKIQMEIIVQESRFENKTPFLKFAKIIEKISIESGVEIEIKCLFNVSIGAPRAVVDLGGLGLENPDSKCDQTLFNKKDHLFIHLFQKTPKLIKIIEEKELSYKVFYSLFNSRSN